MDLGNRAQTAFLITCEGQHLVVPKTIRKGREEFQQLLRLATMWGSALGGIDLGAADVEIAPWLPRTGSYLRAGQGLCLEVVLEL